jgi:hypothetical protein
MGEIRTLRCILIPLERSKRKLLHLEFSVGE